MNSSRIPRTVIAALAAATTALALAACAPESEQEPEASWIAANDELVAELEAAGYTDPLVVATDLSIGYPYATLLDDGSTPDGLDIDLANALGEVLGAEIDLQNTSFDSLIPGLVAERYDFSVSAMFDNTTRQEEVDFVDFLIGASGFLVAADSELTDLTIEDTCGRTIGVMRGSFEEFFLTGQSDQCVADGEAAVDLQVFQQLNEAVLALSAGRIEALCGDKVQNSYLQAQPGSAVAQSGAPIGENPIGMAIVKDSALVEILQQAFQVLIDEGVYTKILEKWGVTDAAVDSSVVNGATS